MKDVFLKYCTVSFSFILLLVSGVGLLLYNNGRVSSMNEYELYKSIAKNSLELFIRSEQDADSLLKKFYDDFDHGIAKVLACASNSKEFLYVVDQLYVLSFYVDNIISNYLLVGKDNNLQRKLQEMQHKMVSYIMEHYTLNEKVFAKISDAYHYWQEHFNELSSAEVKFINDLYGNMMRNGAHLAQEKRSELKAINANMAKLSSSMQMNIASTKNGFYASGIELEGVPESFLKTLKQDDDKGYWIGVDYPTNENIMKYCTIRETRKKLYNEFANRGYPENVDLMKDFFAESQKKAAVLGYENFAEFDITPFNTMAGSVANVEKFLSDIDKATHQKASEEIALLECYARKEMGLEKIHPWDVAYVSYEYKKHVQKYDEKEVSSYLPVTYCIEKILEIYSTFLNVDLAVSNCGNEPWAWDSLLKRVMVRDKKGNLLGSAILDLFPRENKYTHACASALLSPYSNDINGVVPAVCLMIANCARPTDTCDGRFSFNELNTFFHELGHVLHCIVSAKLPFAKFNIFEIPIDFVELPSQMFEQWLQEPKILKMVSKHYETGESLPDDLTDKIIADKQFLLGYWFQKVLLGSYISLHGFKSKNIELEDIVDIYSEKCVGIDKENVNKHWVYSFMHLCGYGSRYYSYLWSLAYALDIFASIKSRDGILDGSVGSDFVNKVLSKGSSCDYKEILEEFMHHPLSLESLYKKMKN